MDRPLNILLSRLSELGKVVDRGHGNYFACCPAHDDKSPSLSIKEAEDGKLLVYCFAQCSTEDVCAAIGLEVRDLFPNDGPERRTKPRWNYKDLLAILAVESTAVEVAASTVAQGKPLAEPDQIRLEQAANRIRQITGVANVA